MMIEIIEGDLLQSDANLILHQVNCRGKMNSGVAKQIRQKYPLAYEDYMRHYETTKDLLGKISISKVGDDKFVVNMFSQLDYGYDGKRYTNYEAIYTCLEKVSKLAKEKDYTVAIPYKIGSDRGGANWNIIYSMINELFNKEQIKIYKYKGDN